MKKTIVSVYTIIHFVVDLACAVLVCNIVTQKMGVGANLLVAILIYNFFAFAVQFPIGIIADKVNKNAIYSAVGCFVVAISFAFSNYGIIACIVAGIGNAMFHVGGGIDVLNISDKKATLSGIFVSTGAMGIYLGGKSASIGFNQYYIIILLLLISILSLVFLYNRIKNNVTNENIKIIKLSKNEVITIICIFVVVCIRSYVGMILMFDWKSVVPFGILSVLSVVFGNILGGIIGDKVGFEKISILLILSAICFVFSFANPFIGLIAILLFNMTMPITLICCSNIFNRNKGLAFGLLTLALFVGTVFTLFDYRYVFNAIGLFTITLITSIILYVSIKYYNKSLKERRIQNESY